MRASTKEVSRSALAAERARQALIGRREALIQRDLGRVSTGRAEESAPGIAPRLLMPGEERELRDIEAAFKRIDRGRWGLCDVCDHAIGHQLLRAMPERAVCLACERK
jgi:hypothetical protein